MQKLKDKSKIPRVPWPFQRQAVAYLATYVADNPASGQALLPLLQTGLGKSVMIVMLCYALQALDPDVHIYVIQPNSALCMHWWVQFGTQDFSLLDLIDPKRPFNVTTLDKLTMPLASQGI